jgi:hypothetical protein
MATFFRAVKESLFHPTPFSGMELMAFQVVTREGQCTPPSGSRAGRAQ